MKVLVIGGGAAGMMAAGTAAAQGNDVILFEKNEKLGKKIYITGKGRCNVTNADLDSFKDNIVTNYKFTLSALQKFNNYDTIELLERYGVSTKIERGNRVFPSSDKASDVTKALERYMHDNCVDIRCNSVVENLIIDSNKIIGLKTIINGVPQKFFADKVIVATGGLSYPTTGSTGDGYRFAKSTGHNIISPRPSLVGFNLKNHNKLLAGNTLKNIKITITDILNGKKLYEDFGEMIFTHSGVSGPVILSASSRINKLDISGFILSIDLKPALSIEQLDKRILSDFEENKNKQLKNALDRLIIKGLQSEIIKRSQINPDIKVNSITKQQRRNLIDVIKNLSFDIQSLGDISTAIITGGGVDCKNINSKNMESKIIKGLFFAGELLDIDACTGGYNIQIALSTGYAAGLNL